MAYLLDTPTFFWWLGKVNKIGGKARTVLEAPESDLNLSVISLFKLETVAQRGQIDLGALRNRLGEVAGRAGIKILPLDAPVAALAGQLSTSLPSDFRLIAAQASYTKLTLLSPDVRFETLELKRVWDT